MSSDRPRSSCRASSFSGRCLAVQGCRWPPARLMQVESRAQPCCARIGTCRRFCSSQPRRTCKGSVGSGSLSSSSTSWPCLWACSCPVVVAGLAHSCCPGSGSQTAIAKRAHKKPSERAQEALRARGFWLHFAAQSKRLVFPLSSDNTNTLEFGHILASSCKFHRAISGPRNPQAISHRAAHT
jgi:hypothetical protein